MLVYTEYLTKEASKSIALTHSEQTQLSLVFLRNKLLEDQVKEELKKDTVDNDDEPIEGI